MPEIPHGHSIAAHTTLGWCASCPARNARDEADAWRGRAGQYLPQVKQAIRERLAAQ